MINLEFQFITCSKNLNGYLMRCMHIKHSTNSKLCYSKETDWAGLNDTVYPQQNIQRSDA